MSLCLDTQGEFALPTRDYSVVARVSGWYDRLQQSHLAASGCPACALGWTPQAQGTCSYKLEARVARFLCSAASVARFSQLGTAFGLRCAFSADRSDLFRKGGLFWPSLLLRSIASRGSHGNSVAHRPQANIFRNSYF